MTTHRAARLSIIVFVLLAAAVVAVLVAIALGSTASAAAPRDPACTTQCSAREPSGAAEPAPRLYLPAIAHGVRMSSEYTPAQPIVTPEPDVPVTGDVQ